MDKYHRPLTSHEKIAMGIVAAIFLFVVAGFLVYELPSFNLRDRDFLLSIAYVVAMVITFLQVSTRLIRQGAWKEGALEQKMEDDQTRNVAGNLAQPRKVKILKGVFLALLTPFLVWFLVYREVQGFRDSIWLMGGVFILFILIWITRDWYLERRYTRK